MNYFQVMAALALICDKVVQGSPTPPSPFWFAFPDGSQYNAWVTIPMTPAVPADNSTNPPTAAVPAAPIPPPTGTVPVEPLEGFGIFAALLQFTNSVQGATLQQDNKLWFAFTPEGGVETYTCINLVRFT